MFAVSAGAYPGACRGRGKSQAPAGGKAHIDNIGSAAGGPSDPRPPSNGAAGSYRLGARLDDFAEIYEGHHPRIPGPFVIKLFGRLEREISVALAAFSKEAGRISILHHPHIAQVFDSGVFADGRPFVAMEHLRGRTLEEHLTLRGPLPLAHLILVLRGVVAALSAAHAAGVVHREIRPNNIFLVEGGDNEPGVVKLLGFGVSWLTWASGSVPSGVRTDDARYLAPEQARYEPADDDPRVDQFAVAAVVCRVLHGTAPLPANRVATDADRIAEAAAEAEAGPISPFQHRVAAVKGVLIKALSEKRADRYPSVGAFFVAFEKSLEDSASSTIPAPAEPSSIPASATGPADGVASKKLNVPAIAEPRDPMPKKDSVNREGTLAKRFFQEGDLEERNKYKDSSLARDPAAPDPDKEFTSFNRVPRRRKPLAVVAMIAVVAVGGLAAWGVGWRSPRTVWHESRLGRTIYLLRAGLPGAEASSPDPTSTATVAASVPVAASATVPVAVPVPVPVPVPVAVPVPVPVAVPVPVPVSVAVPVPVSVPASVAVPVPVAVPVSLPLAPAASATVPAVARPEAAPPVISPHRHRTSALRGYVWSPAEQRLVPSRSVAAAPDPPPP